MRRGCTPGIAWMWAPKFLCRNQPVPSSRRVDGVGRPKFDFHAGARCDESLQTSRCSNKAWKVCGRFKPSHCGKYIARKSPGGGGFARTCQSSARAPEIDVVSLKISFSSVLGSVSMTWSGAARRGGTAGAKRALAVVAAHSSPRITRGRAIAQARCVRVSGFSTSSFTTSLCVYERQAPGLHISVFR